MHNNSTRRADEKPAEPILLTEKEAGRLMGFAPKTLQAWRSRGHVELPFVRISKGCVRYRRSDIYAWIDRQVRNSTADDAARGLVLRQPRKKEEAIDNDESDGS